jgi:hypothetical protein
MSNKGDTPTTQWLKSIKDELNTKNEEEDNTPYTNLLNTMNDDLNKDAIVFKSAKRPKHNKSADDGSVSKESDLSNEVKTLHKSVNELFNYSKKFDKAIANKEEKEDLNEMEEDDGTDPSKMICMVTATMISRFDSKKKIIEQWDSLTERVKADFPKQVHVWIKALNAGVYDNSLSLYQMHVVTFVGLKITYTHTERKTACFQVQISNEYIFKIFSIFGMLDDVLEL